MEHRRKRCRQFHGLFSRRSRHYSSSSSCAGYNSHFPWLKPGRLTCCSNYQKGHSLFRSHRRSQDCLGLLAALLSASLWVCLATYQNLPVSTTHSIVGAMIGFGVVAGGLSAVNWRQVVYIVISWVLSPLLTAGGAFVMFRFIDKAVLARMDTTGGVARTTPILIAATLGIMTLSLLLRHPSRKQSQLGCGWSLCDVFGSCSATVM